MVPNQLTLDPTKLIGALMNPNGGTLIPSVARLLL